MMIRRILLIAGIALAILVVAVAAFLLFVDVNRFRGPVQAQLQRTLGRSVTLGPMHMKLFPLAISVADVTIGEAPEFQSSRPFAKAKEVNIRAELMPLLSGRVVVRSIRLIQPVIELVRNKQDVWNVSTLVRGGQSGSDTSVSIDELEIVDGAVGVTDLVARKARVVYQPIGLRVKDFAPGKALDTELNVRLPGSGDQTITVQARGHDGRDLSGHVSLKQVALSALQQFIGSGASGVDGTLSGDTDLRSDHGILIATGKMKLAQPRVRGSALGFDVAAEYKLNYDSTRDLLDIRSLEAHLGPSPMSVSGQADFKAKEALLKATVRNGSLVEFARFAGVPAELKGKASLDLALRAPLDRPSRADVQFNLAVDEVNVIQPGASSASSGGATQSSGIEEITGRGKLTAGTIRYGTIVVTQLQADCTIDKGIIRLAPIMANLYGGRQAGSIVVDARHAHPAFSIQSKLDQVDANQLLSATTSLRQTLYGLLATNANLQFAARPGEDIARSLNGSMNLKLQQGKLSGINLMNEVASVAQFLGFRKSADVTTNIVDLVGDLNIVNGVARTDNLKLTLQDGSALATGTTNLADQSLNMKLLVTLHKGLSTQVGGSKIGGFMTTAFANNQGELVVPVSVTGTFANPRVTPDPARMAQTRLKSLVPTSPANVTEKVDSIIDMFRRKK
jgi:uncharacterized protein involved in outer membrane biogenesis